jgi:DNA-binding NarL/FixJ family response regulator
MSQQRVIKILTVDDHHLIREGIATLVGSQTNMELIAHASSGMDAIQLYRQHRPDITLMDLRLPGLSGIDATTESRARESTPVMLLLADRDENISAAAIPF